MATLFWARWSASNQFDDGWYVWCYVAEADRSLWRLFFVSRIFWLLDDLCNPVPHLAPLPSRNFTSSHSSQGIETETVILLDLIKSIWSYLIPLADSPSAAKLGQSMSQRRQQKIKVAQNKYPEVSTRINGKLYLEKPPRCSSRRFFSYRLAGNQTRISDARSNQWNDFHIPIEPDGRRRQRICATRSQVGGGRGLSRKRNWSILPVSKDSIRKAEWVKENN